MNNKVDNKFSKLTAILALSFMMLLSACTSSTNMGTTGVDRKQLMLMSSAQMDALVKRSYSKTLSKARANGVLDRNRKQLNRLQNIANNIIAQTPVFRKDASQWNWEVHVIQDDMLNAYVLPGGKIMFYSGIIEKLNLTDDEIAAIMGHEVAHALREHARERASRQMATNLGFSILSKSIGLSQGQAQLAGLINQFGVTLPHSRSQESEADVIGLELAARAGYKPTSAVTLWKKMQAAKGRGGPEFMSTHPSSSSRISKLQSIVPTVQPLYEQASIGGKYLMDNNPPKKTSKKSKNKFRKYKGK